MYNPYFRCEISNDNVDVCLNLFLNVFFMFITMNLWNGPAEVILEWVDVPTN